MHAKASTDNASTVKPHPYLLPSLIQIVHVAADRGKPACLHDADASQCQCHPCPLVGTSAQLSWHQHIQGATQTDKNSSFYVISSNTTRKPMRILLYILKNLLGWLRPLEIKNILGWLSPGHHLAEHKVGRSRSRTGGRESRKCALLRERMRAPVRHACVMHACASRQWHACVHCSGMHACTSGMVQQAPVTRSRDMQCQ